MAAPLNIFFIYTDTYHNLMNFMLSERGQSQKATYSSIFMKGQNRQTYIDRNRLVIA